MIYRDVFRDLDDWLLRQDAKILVLRGARQVGKTTAVRELSGVTGREFSILEVNLEEHPELEAVLATMNADRILEELSFTAGLSPMEGDLVFLDEVQAAPSALQALRYFRERRPELRYAAAGSLLDVELGRHPVTMPVGRMEYLYMGPLTFEEFLAAGGNASMELDLMRSWVPGASFPHAAHDRLLNALREYLVVGGMPEAVARYHDTGAVEEAARECAAVLATYRDDFAKYASGGDLLLLRRVFDWVPARAGDKVTYSRISSDHRARSVRRAIDLLCDARVVFPVTHSAGNGLPLSGEERGTVFKLYFLDVGLMAHASGVSRIPFERIMDGDFVNRGRLAEQFVAQHLLYRRPSWERPVLHYWQREGKKGNAEVDFLVEGRGEVVPVEVKAGSSGSMKSLLRFVQEKKSPVAVRLDANPPSFQHVEHRLADGMHGSVPVAFDLLSLPLYMVGEIGRLIDAC